MAMGNITRHLKHLGMAAILATGLFVVVHYALLEFLIQQREFDIVLSVQPRNSFKLTCSYNSLPSQIGTEYYEYDVSSAETKEVVLPFPKDKTLKRIFLFSNPRNADFTLTRIALRNAYIERSWSAKDLENKIVAMSPAGIKSLPYALSPDGGFDLKFTRRNWLAVINEGWAEELYIDLRALPFKVSLFTAMIGFLFFFILFSLQPKWVHPSGYPLIFTSLFLLIIFTPFFSEKEMDTTENRTLAPFPDLHQLIWKIPDAYTRYFNDHFPYRNYLANINNSIKVELFNTSPMPDHVRIGKDGWLFNYAPDIREVQIADSLFSEAQLQKITRILEEKRDWLAMQDIEFYFLMPPLKHTIYPEYLPPILKRKQEINKRVQLIYYLREHSDIHFIDPSEVLKAKKDSAQLYYKTDTHWNQLGAFLVYRQLMEMIRQYHPELSMFSIDDYTIERTKEYSGDLMSMMNLDTFFYREPYILVPKYVQHAIPYTYKPKVGVEVEYMHYQNTDTTGLRLLVIRDSYSNYIRPHISEHFSYTGYSWTPFLEPQRVAIDKPDLVIYEIVERYINLMLIENPPEVTEALKNR